MIIEPIDTWGTGVFSGSGASIDEAVRQADRARRAQIHERHPDDPAMLGMANHGELEYDLAIQVSVSPTGGTRYTALLRRL